MPLSAASLPGRPVPSPPPRDPGSGLGLATRFLSEEDNFFCALCNFALTAVFYLCIVLKQAAPPTRTAARPGLAERPWKPSSTPCPQAVLTEAVEDYLTGEMYSRFFFDSATTSVILIVVISLAAFVAILFMLQQLAAAAAKPFIRLQSTGKEPELHLGEACTWHLFLSHIWGSGQDQNATIKRQLCLLLPDVSIFLDVDDLESIDKLEEYIAGSQLISLFCSKGYFKSRNCLREVHATLETQKPFCLVHDPDKGGAPLDVIKNDECPDELRGHTAGLSNMRRCRFVGCRLRQRAQLSN